MDVLITTFLPNIMDFSIIIRIFAEKYSPINIKDLWQTENLN